MDTPVVNGTAYPTFQVGPAAYRFQVLNASNDRGLNLGLYVAEPVTLSPIITSPGSGYTNPTVTIGGCTGGTAFAQVGDGVDPTTGVPFTAGIVGITMGTQPSACTTPTIHHRRYRSRRRHRRGRFRCDVHEHGRAYGSGDTGHRGQGVAELLDKGCPWLEEVKSPTSRLTAPLTDRPAGELLANVFLGPRLHRRNFRRKWRTAQLG